MRSPEAHPGIGLLWPVAARQLFEDAEKPVDAVPTPFAAWNRACRGHGGQKGLGRGWHVVIGADTKQGKTLLGLQCALAAVLAGHSVGFLNLEMAREQLQTRLYSQFSGVPSWQLEPGGLDRTKAAAVVEQLQALKDSTYGVNLWSNRDPVTSLPDALDYLTGWVEGWHVRLLVVDYMQLIESPDASGIADEIRKISAHLVQLTHTHQVNTIVLSQLSNDGAQTSPHAGSLYGGRRIAQDADQVLFLDHTKRQTRSEVRNDREHWYTRTWLKLAYNRHGPPADIPIEWDWDSLKATEAKQDEEDKWPAPNGGAA